MLKHLGERPVGDVLYADPNLKRRKFELAQLKPEHTDYELALIHSEVRPDYLWTRRSIFIVNDQPILINEIFLPSILSRKQ